MSDAPILPSSAPTPSRYTKDDFVSGADVRWCPGCGDYSILSVMQKTLAQYTTTDRENHVFISGIGCSSRLPYYMNNYGFHTIHGRAPSIATGLKCVRPDLTVWVITGDGDGLSIGGNHLIHTLRRNIDIKIILINNEIYGLTKGQYSPTSKKGKVAKSTPEGSIDYPINPLCIAIAAEATFVARTVDTDPRHMGQVLEKAMNHKGSVFVEILQNCVIFNKDTHQPIVGRENRDDRAIYLETGKPLIFGKNRDRGIKVDGLKPEIVDLSAHPDEVSNLLTHNPNAQEPNYAYFLTQMEYPYLPVPFGVFRDTQRATYEDMMTEQARNSTAKKGPGTLETLLFNDEVWKIEDSKKGAETSTLSDKKFIGSESTERKYWSEGLQTQAKGDQPKTTKDNLQRLLMNEKVSDFISPAPALVFSTDSTLQEIVDSFQAHPKKGCVLIVDKDKKFVGIITIRDILWRVAGLYRDLTKVTADKIMTARPETVHKDTPLSFAVHKMAIGRFRHVPIIENGKPIGVVSTRDIIEYLAEKK